MSMRFNLHHLQCFPWARLHSAPSHGTHALFNTKSFGRITSRRSFRIPTARTAGPTPYFVPKTAALLVAIGLVAGVRVAVTDERSWFQSERLRAESADDAAGWPHGAAVVIHRGQRRELHEVGRDWDTEGGREGEQRRLQPPTQARGSEGDGATREKGENTRWWSDIMTRVSGMGDTISGFLMPDWVRFVPGFVTKLQSELSMAPGSLAEEIWHEANDPESNPEIVWEASVRVSDDLCREEKMFRRHRLLHTTRALAKYLEIPEDEINYEDVPTIAMCGSGGGLRALVAGSSSYLSAKEAGLFDCITYTAGVSGSCWLQALFYSTLTDQCHETLIRHLKNRVNVHLAFPPTALNLLNSAPTNKYLLCGLVERLNAVPDADLGIVDAYGLLVASRLMVPKGELAVNDQDLKVSNQRMYIDGGENPLPIYTAVRHEIPFTPKDEHEATEAIETAKREAWFQWFEFTPYEFWCEELHAGIPTWALGRKFDGGRTVWRENGLAVPEVRVPLLMGIWGSAFCATLSHYYREIQPIMSGLVGFDSINQLISAREEDLVKVHPIDPAAIPNFVRGMKDQLPQSVPASIFQSQQLALMDAGISNNLPIYPLLRPGRDVDILIAFDASSDQRSDNWLRVVDGYARQRGIKGWPVGAGWPDPIETREQAADELEAAQAESEQEATQKLRAAQEDQEAAEKQRQPPRETQPEDLGFCTVWVGSIEERTSDEEPPPTKRVEADDWELTRDDAGLAVVYFPLLPNPKVPGVDPQTSEFMSTWNSVYTPEQIDSVVALARANFDAGAERTRQTVRAVYERKKRERLRREAEERSHHRQRLARLGLLGRHETHGDVGDHFS